MDREQTSSTAMTTSTASRLSRPRSPVNEASVVSYRTWSDTLHYNVGFSVAHLRWVDLLKALQHVQHSGGDVLLCKACGSRESRALEQPCPSGDGSGGDGNSASREAGGWTTESDTEERHFVGRCVTRTLRADCRGLRRPADSEHTLGKRR